MLGRGTMCVLRYDDARRIDSCDLGHCRRRHIDMLHLHGHIKSTAMVRRSGGQVVCQGYRRCVKELGHVWRQSYGHLVVSLFKRASRSWEVAGRRVAPVNAHSQNFRPLPPSDRPESPSLSLPDQPRALHSQVDYCRTAAPLSPSTAEGLNWLLRTRCTFPSPRITNSKLAAHQIHIQRQQIRGLF